MQKSYKKALTIGIATFSAVALIATGTAAFILVTGGSDSLDGSISVDVKDNSIELDAYVGSVGTNTVSYTFDAAANDTTGRVQWDGAHTESLTSTITVSIKPAEGANITQAEINDGYSLSYTVKVTNDDSGNFAKYVTTKGTSEEKTATSEEFLQLTSSAPTGSDIANTDLVSVGEANAIAMPTGESTTTTFNLNFAWDSFFNYQNPSLYFDDSGTSGGASIELTGVKGALNELQSLNNVQLKITVTAVKK